MNMKYSLGLAGHSFSLTANSLGLGVRGYTSLYACSLWDGFVYLVDKR